jgi:hypothetical protein
VLSIVWFCPGFVEDRNLCLNVRDDVERERGLHYRVARLGEGKDNRIVFFVSAVCKPEAFTKRIIKKPVVVDVAQSWVNHFNCCATCVS